ncbi:MAG: hypothetical protein HRU19_14680 [Pseudobacteriovorax sp.]|nr:hypothetical protein [Pseudobacteriovorax sp.]
MSKQDERLVEGDDYYWDSGYMVLTSSYLKKRGYCCSNGCRHCPYGSKDQSPTDN